MTRGHHPLRGGFPSILLATTLVLAILLCCTIQLTTSSPSGSDIHTQAQPSTNNTTAILYDYNDLDQISPQQQQQQHQHQHQQHSLCNLNDDPDGEHNHGDEEDKDPLLNTVDYFNIAPAMVAYGQSGDNPELAANFSGGFHCKTDCAGGTWDFSFDSTLLGWMDPYHLMLYVYHDDGELLFANPAPVVSGNGRVRFTFPRELLGKPVVLLGNFTLMGHLLYKTTDDFSYTKSNYIHTTLTLTLNRNHPNATFHDYTQHMQMYQYYSPPLADSGLVTVANLFQEGLYVYNHLSFMLAGYKNALSTQTYAAINVTLLGPVEFSPLDEDAHDGHDHDDHGDHDDENHPPLQQNVQHDEEDHILECYFNRHAVEVTLSHRSHRRILLTLNQSDPMVAEMIQATFFENSFIQFHCPDLLVRAHLGFANNTMAVSALLLEYSTSKHPPVENTELPYNPIPFVAPFNPYRTFNALKQFDPDVPHDGGDEDHHDEDHQFKMQQTSNNNDNKNNDNKNNKKNNNNIQTTLSNQTYPYREFKWNTPPSLVRTSTFSANGVISCSFIYTYYDLDAMNYLFHSAHIEYTGVSYEDPEGSEILVYTRPSDPTIKPILNDDGSSISSYETLYPTQNRWLPIYEARSTYRRSILTSTAVSLDFDVTFERYGEEEFNNTETGEAGLKTRNVELIISIPYEKDGLTAQNVQCGLTITKDVCRSDDAYTWIACFSSYLENNPHFDPPNPPEELKYRLAMLQFYQENMEAFKDSEGFYTSTMHTPGLSPHAARNGGRVGKAFGKDKNNNNNDDNIEDQEDVQQQEKQQQTEQQQNMDNNNNNNNNDNTSTNNLEFILQQNLATIDWSPELNPANAFSYLTTPPRFNDTAIHIAPFSGDPEEPISHFQARLNYVAEESKTTSYFNVITFTLPLRHFELIERPFHRNTDQEDDGIINNSHLCTFTDKNGTIPVGDKPGQVAVELHSDRLILTGWEKISIVFPLMIDCKRIVFLQVPVTDVPCLIDFTCYTPWTSIFTRSGGEILSTTPKPGQGDVVERLLRQYDGPQLDILQTHHTRTTDKTFADVFAQRQNKFVSGTHSSEDGVQVRSLYDFVVAVAQGLYDLLPTHIQQQFESPRGFVQRQTRQYKEQSMQQQFVAQQQQQSTPTRVIDISSSSSPSLSTQAFNGDNASADGVHNDSDEEQVVSYYNSARKVTLINKKLIQELKTARDVGTLQNNTNIRTKKTTTTHIANNMNTLSLRDDATEAGSHLDLREFLAQGNRAVFAVEFGYSNPDELPFRILAHFFRIKPQNVGNEVFSGVLLILVVLSVSLFAILVLLLLCIKCKWMSRIQKKFHAYRTKHRTKVKKPLSIVEIETKYNTEWPMPYYSQVDEFEN